MLLDDEQDQNGPVIVPPMVAATDTSKNTAMYVLQNQQAQSATLHAQAIATSVAPVALPLVPIDDMSLMTKGIPTDPDTMPPGQSQWHLVGTWGLNADDIWPYYTGQGSMVAVIDDGFQYTHHEISPNYRTDLDYDAGGGDNDPGPFYAGDNHGTSVIGTIIADDNGSGTVGVAFDAQAYGVRMDFGGGGTLDDTVAAFQRVITTGADVINNSWGYTQAFSDTTKINFAGQDFIDVVARFETLVDSGRGGLGTNIVFSAGNDRAGGNNVNYHNMQNSIYVITVAAIDQDGTYSNFSTPGAAILVSAGGTNVYTTDRTGAPGYNPSGDYVNFSGTSASAPIVTGAVAVILEANPDLGWRDVQQILAYSAQHNDPSSTGWQYNGANNWNGGGLHFSHDYGYGAVDLAAAVRLAETWTLTQTSANMTTVPPASISPSLAIPATGTINSSINIGTDIEIQKIIIDLDITHARAGDLVVTLISPDGTQSVLIDHPVNGTYTSIYGVTGINFETTSNAHWGESSAGTWTLRVQDTVGGNAGTLNSWSISFVGNTQSNDDLHVYTDDYANFTGAGNAARRSLIDAGGTDTINLAAVTGNTVLNMNAGAASTIAGNTLNIGAGTIIENAYLGDGNDTVNGNSAANTIWGGRGDDTVTGTAGNDALDGGAGTDTVSYLDVIANFSFNFIDSITVEITSTLGSWMDTVVNFENFMFTDVTYDRAGLEAYAGGGGGGGGGLNTIMGTASSDNLKGTPGRDDIYGGDSFDTLYGYGDSDIIHGENGNDYLYGQDGDDTLYGGDGNDMMLGDNGDDTLSGEGGDDVMYGGAGSDTVIYDADSDGFLIYRGTSTHLIVNDMNGVFGIDKVMNDIEFIQFNDTTLDLNAMAFVYGGAAWGTMPTVNGTAGADSLNGTNANDTINGLDGNDTVRGNYGDDTLNGGYGNDNLQGGDGNDTLSGDDGNDTLSGQNGDDTINGGAGDDIIYGGAGADTALYSVLSDGIIIYRVNSSYLTVQDTSGALGTDRVYNDMEFIQFNDVTIDLSVTTFTLNGAAWGTPADIIGTAGAETLNGSAADDTIYGGDGNDYLYGKVGNDTLYGEGGNDVLNGDVGDDILIGGAGADTLYGRAGNDMFGFATIGDGVDRVIDYNTGDTLNITDILSGYTPGVSDISEFVSLTRSGSTTTRFFIDTDGGGDNYVEAFTVNNPFTGQTAQDLLDNGTLIANQPL